MTILLTYAPIAQDSKTGTVFGGLPIAPEGSAFSWPCCRTCGGAMQFLGRLYVPERVGGRGRQFILLFMCQNNPGQCGDGHAASGGNAAICFEANGRFELVPAPEGGVVTRSVMYGAERVDVDEARYDAAREKWAEDSDRSRRHVLGRLLGAPTWLRKDQTPVCSCNRQMQFVAQLEQGPDYRTEMSFGNGCAYVFDCECGRAAMLWQAAKGF
ncbi:hypothetical protein SAMN04488038_101390 [Solimonas aquatica]|uniref:Uncharacterized protein n=1 Tax=Solimonas aquatica TaxID=489703 RepID=A0A1H9AG49_9GAMM|nr:hypothetical protein [Solimonas aquatica]SEP75565.1 hypothetical protein SAMN04488038_101390 [Solimonas aquatica]